MNPSGYSSLGMSAQGLDSPVLIVAPGAWESYCTTQASLSLAFTSDTQGRVHPLSSHLGGSERRQRGAEGSGNTGLVYSKEAHGVVLESCHSH